MAYRGQIENLHFSATAPRKSYFLFPVCADCRQPLQFIDRHWLQTERFYQNALVITGVFNKTRRLQSVHWYLHRLQSVLLKKCTCYNQCAQPFLPKRTGNSWCTQSPMQFLSILSMQETSWRKFFLNVHRNWYKI